MEVIFICKCLKFAGFIKLPRKSFTFLKIKAKNLTESILKVRTLSRFSGVESRENIVLMQQLNTI